MSLVVVVEYTPLYLQYWLPLYRIFPLAVLVGAIINKVVNELEEYRRQSKDKNKK